MMTATCAGVDLSERQEIEAVTPVPEHTLVRFYLLSYRPGPCRLPRTCRSTKHGQRWLYRCSCGKEGFATQAYCGEDMEAKVRRNHRQHRRYRLGLLPARKSKGHKSVTTRGVAGGSGHTTT